MIIRRSRGFRSKIFPSVILESLNIKTIWNFPGTWNISILSTRWELRDSRAGTVKACRENLARLSLETEGPDKTLVFVVHGGTIMAVMEALAKERKSYYDWQVGNGEGIFGEIEAPDGRIGQVRFLRNNPVS